MNSLPPRRTTSQRIHLSPAFHCPAVGNTVTIWKRDGDDLRMTVPIPLKTAVAGGSVDVQTPAGTVTLKVPEGSNTGTVLRLRNKGVQFKDKPGHLYVRLEIMLEDPKDPGLKEWAAGR